MFLLPSVFTRISPVKLTNSAKSPSLTTLHLLTIVPQSPQSPVQSPHIVITVKANTMKRSKPDHTRRSMNDVIEYNVESNAFERLPGKLETPRVNFAASVIYTDEDC